MVMNITRDQIKEFSHKALMADSNINQADKLGYQFAGAFIYQDQSGNFQHARPRWENLTTGNKWLRPVSEKSGRLALGLPEYPNGKPLYNLPKIKDADTVYFVEGEKVAAYLSTVGIVATTCGGAQDHDKADLSPLSGKAVYLWPDNDDAGRKHMEAVRSLLNGLGCTTHLINIDALELPLKGDAYDWLKINHSGAIAKDAPMELRAKAKDAVLNLACVVDADLSNSVIRKTPITETDTSSVVVAEIIPKPNQLKVKPEIQINLVQGSSVKMRPVIWLIDQWLPMGKLTLLAGAGGTGKTTLALGIAAAITSGGMFPNGQRYLGASNVLIWSSEDDPEDILTPRLAAMGANLDKVLILKNAKEDDKDRTFNPATDLESLKIALDKVGGVALILLDPVIGIVKGNSDKATDVREGLDPLVGFAQDQQCAIIGISHFGKGGQGKDPAERVLGSQAFTALPRMVWATVVNKETGDRVLVRAKTNLSARDGGFLYSIEQTQYEGIDTSVVAWKGQIEGSSHQIISDAEAVESDDEDDHENNGSSRDFAKQFLTDLLNEKDVLNKELKAQAKDADIAWATVRRASKDLGVIKYNSVMLGGWVWSFKNSSEKQAIQNAYLSCSNGEAKLLTPLVLEQPEQPEQVPADKGSQLAQSLEKGEVAHLLTHTEHRASEGDLAQKPSKNPNTGPYEVTFL
jgi:putative DNA primase/helicase